MIEVLRPGPLLTVQDLGRPGLREYGVPLSGAADPESLRTVNLLVGNPPGAPGLEISLGGCALRWTAQGVLALGGADLGATLERGGRREAAPLWRTLKVEAGSLLHTSGARRGARLYLALAGGLDVPRVLGSASTYLPARLGGLEGRALRAGDVLPLGPTGPAGGRWRSSPQGVFELAARFPPASLLPPPPLPWVRAVAGPEYASFTPPSRRAFWREPFEVTPRSDRMGARLTGTALTRFERGELFSSAVYPGTVQVPHGGLPIVLLADGQTVGGYPRIAQVIQADLGRFAQFAPGAPVHFVRVGPDEARRAYLARERRLATLARALDFERSRT